MCGGGGGGGGYDSTADDRAAYRRSLELQAEQQRADDATAKAEAEKAAQRTKFTTDLGDAKKKALEEGHTYFDTRNYTRDDAILQSIIDKAALSIPDLDPSPGRYFTDDTFQSGLDRVAQGTRERLQNEISGTGKFVPDFEKTLIPDTSDDAILNTILGEQKKSAQQGIDFNRQRGILSPIGYESAMAELENQGKAGFGVLDEIGNSVLGKIRGDVRGIGDKANSLASGYVYGRDVPDVSGLYGEATNLASTKLNDLEKSIRGSTFGVNVFDPAKAMQAGGSTQGPIDIQGPGTVGFGGPSEAANKKRGLGGTSVF